MIFQESLRIQINYFSFIESRHKEIVMQRKFYSVFKTKSCTLNGAQNSRLKRVLNSYKRIQKYYHYDNSGDF